MPDVAATCGSSEQFKKLLNRATQILMERGDWPGTLVPIRVMARRGCVVWPRYVQRVRRINNCNIPIKVGTIWYDYVDKQDYVGWCGASFYAWDGNGAAYRGLSQAMAQQTMVSQGRVPTFDDIPSDAPRYVRCYCLAQKDIGKKVRIFGADENNLILQTKNADGTYEDGIDVTLAIPFGSTSVYVSRIDAVVKEVTQKNVPMYAYEPVSDTMLQLADYAAGETNPSYAKDRLFVPSDCRCNSAVTLIALVKLAFIPVVADDDIVLIPSISALESAIQATKYKQSGNAQEFQNFMQLAVNDLNHILENELPIDQTPVDGGFGGGISVGRQQLV